MKVTLICALLGFASVVINSEYEEISEFSDKIGWKNKLEAYTGCCMDINQCAKACCFNPFCSSFFYNGNTEKCQLHSGVLNDTSFTDISTGSRYYRCQKDLCPDGWYSYNGNCYLVKRDGPLSWTAAMDYCKQKGGYLAEIRSKNDYIYIVRLLSGLKGFSTPYFWLGGTDVETEGIWRWNSDKEQISFTAWKPGQPNNLNGFEHYLCMQIYPDVSIYKWHDRHVTTNIDFICQTVYQGTERNCCRNATSI